MKTCAKCKTELGLEMFYFNKGKPGSWCKPCHRKAELIYRSSPKAREKKKVASKRSHVAAQKRNEEIILKMKAQACIDCGVHFPPEAMDFDHVRGDKRFCIAEVMHFSIPIEDLMSEIEKCDIVCAFCHRMRTFTRTLRKLEVTKKMRRIRQYQATINEIKSSSPCSKCGRFGHPCQMDFDHIDPSKKTCTVSEIVNKGVTMESIMAEVAKCRVLCVTCHRIITKEQREQDPEKFFKRTGT